jgi:hypothetical protein
VIHLGLGGLRHSQECLSIQAEYNLTSVLEGNTVGDVVKLLGNVGCQVEMGTSIRIIRRTYVGSVVIQLHYCVVQY